MYVRKHYHAIDQNIHVPPSIPPMVPEKVPEAGSSDGVKMVRKQLAWPSYAFLAI